jgi:hypothetical protein
MTDKPDVSKDLVFEQPYHLSTASWDEGQKRYDDWTVAGLEEVLWRIRAAGGTDSTPVKVNYRPEESVRAMHVEAFPVEIPRRQHEPEPVMDLPPTLKPAWLVTAERTGAWVGGSMAVVLVLLLAAKAIMLAFGWLF